MGYSQYLRIETVAGGVMCTTKEFIRACHTLLDFPFNPAHREVRHAWIRSGFQWLKVERQNYLSLVAT